MSKIAVIYMSKYGATKKYAEWLGEDLSADVIELKNAKIDHIEKYDLIIYGRGIYASGIAGFSYISKNYDRLKNKKIIVFGVGASPFSEEWLTALKEHNLKGHLSDIPCFYFRGAWNEERMSWADRMLGRLLKKMVAKKDPAKYEPWEAALMETIGSSRDWTDRSQIKQIVEYVKNHSI